MTVNFQQITGLISSCWKHKHRFMSKLQFPISLRLQLFFV